MFNEFAKEGNCGELSMPTLAFVLIVFCGIFVGDVKEQEKLWKCS